MRSSRIDSILQSVKQLDEPIRVHGASASARALLLLQWHLEAKRSLVVLCADDDASNALAADLETLAQVILRKTIHALVLPTWEQSPYSPIAPSLKTRLERLATLSELKETQSPIILVTSLAAACQATLPVKKFLESAMLLSVEDSVDTREQLIFNLLEAGYLRVDPVEDPGTFAVRGDIVDVFPPGCVQPYRIELFGDIVERIRNFEPGTQRTTPEEANKIQKIRIPPAREALINRANTNLVREQIKARADDLGISRGTRDPILTSLQEGVYPGHSDAWVPFAYENTATLWDYVPADWLVAWNDELSCLQELDEFLAEQKSSSEEAPKAGLIMPAVEALFPWTAALESRIRAQSRLYLDRLEMANLEPALDPDLGPEQSDNSLVIATRHRVVVNGNTDLTGSRHSLGELEPKLRLWLKQGFRVLALAATQSQLERIRFLLEERNFPCRPQGEPAPHVIALGIGTLTEGFRWPGEGLVVLNESEILGARHVRKQRRKATGESGSAAKDWSGLQALSDLAINDAVVHVDHGIGKYQGLVRVALSGAPSDFLLLEYAGKDKLYIPVYRLNVIQKYVGSGDHVQLDKLGGAQFAKAKEKVREAVKKLAIDLVQLYAERKVRPGIPFSPRDAAYREFEARFLFDETPDQLRAIDDTLADMESGRVMDRLICGDVGYGKTEVAMRAAFRAVSDGKQVAVLVPTTVLAHQHEQNFKARMKDYPLLIESVSRFKSAKEQKRVLSDLTQGRVDIVVGTHRLLSRDVRFKDLGLVIVDEEHRFGVEHKERLKALRTNTHVLTLTATPIPRTLNMALSGLRDISLINTPPVDRLPIRTYVSRFDETLIKQAIEVELNRGGQAFFVHNRVSDIYQIANRIHELVPNSQVIVGHGQMSEGELEKVMMAFYEKKANILVCTSIIESGIDVPTANTILVNRADTFGLAQLYQIRGRVGRAQTRAYAYLLLPSEGAVTEDAKKRLEVIQRFVELGSGFSIASHDLEIRGGGDLLGPQQSGHIAAVGFDLYTELLEEAIAALRGQPLEPEDSSREPEIKTSFPAYLPEGYVPDVHQRLSLYRRFSAATQESEVDRMEEELHDRFGSLPPEAQNLLWVIRIKQVLKRVGIDALTAGPEKVSLIPGPGSRLDPVRAIALVAGNPRDYQLLPDSKFVARIPAGSLRDLFFGLETLFKGLSID